MVAIIIGLIVLVIVSINALGKGDDSGKWIAIIGGGIIFLWLLLISF